MVHVCSMSDLHHLPLLRNPSNLIYIRIHAQMGIIRLRFARYILLLRFCENRLHKVGVNALKEDT